MKIGIVGSGGIIPVCLEGLQESGEWEAAAICVREQSEEKGKALAEQYGIGKVYTNYMDFLNDREFEAVYVGIVNAFHYKYAKKALEAGKHVILEKPLTSTAEQTETLLELAGERGLLVLEAITTLYLPNYLYIKERLHELGEIKLVQANFSQYSSRYDKYQEGVVTPVFDPDLDGGALYDINVYNLHFAADLFGMPESIEAFCNYGFNGVDTSGIIVMKYEGFLAQCSGAKDSGSPNFAMVQGTKGYLKVEGSINACPLVTGCIQGREIRFDGNHFKNRMTDQFVKFSRWISEREDRKGALEKMDESLQVMRLLEASRDTALAKCSE